jgi:hypothetical protein
LIIGESDYREKNYKMDMKNLSKLKGSENFAHWKVQIKFFLKTKGLERFLMQNAVAGNDKDQKQNDEALGYVSLLCSEDLYSLIEDQTSVKGLMKILEDKFENKGICQEYYDYSLFNV